MFPSHVLVTGGAAGIGAAACAELLRRGSAVTIVDRDPGVTERASARVETVVGNAADRAVIVQAIRAGTARFGRTPDAAVLNVAGARYGDVFDLTDDDFTHTISHTFGSFVAGLEGLVEEGVHSAAVVGISSGSAHFGEPTRTAYAIAKAGLEAAIESSAQHPDFSRFRVNGIAPGPTRTAANAENRRLRGTADSVAERTPLGRWGEAADMAGPIAFLLSDAAAGLRGQVIPVDGGVAALGPIFPPRATRLPAIPPSGAMAVTTVCGHHSGDYRDALTATARGIAGAGATNLSGAIVVGCVDELARPSQAQPEEILRRTRELAAAAVPRLGDGAALALVLCAASTATMDAGLARTTRAMLAALCRGAAVEEARRGVRVNGLLAGPCDSPRQATPRLADAAAFLTSSDAQWITGATLTITSAINSDAPRKAGK